MDNLSAVVLSYNNFRDVLAGKTSSKASKREPQSNHSIQRITETSKEYASAAESDERSRQPSRIARANSLD